MLVLLSIIGIVEINIVNTDNPFVDFFEGHIIGAILAAFFIYPILVLLKKVTEKAAVSFEFGTVPRDLIFGTILVLSGAGYWLASLYLLSDMFDNPGDEFFLFITISMMVSGVTVTSSGAVITGGTRIVVALKEVSLERFFPWLANYLQRIFNPVYRKYRVLVCLGYLNDMTFFQVARRLKSEGEDEFINKTLGKGDQRN